MAGGFAFLARATLLSIATILLATVALGIAMRGFDRVFALNRDLHTRYPLLERRANRYLPALRSTVKAVVTVLTLLVLLEIWARGPSNGSPPNVGRAWSAGSFRSASCFLSESSPGSWPMRSLSACAPAIPPRRG